MTVRVTSGASGLGSRSPGAELDYQPLLADFVITAITPAVDVILTANGLTFNGSESIMAEFFAPEMSCPATEVTFVLYLYDNGVELGRVGQGFGCSSNRSIGFPVHCTQRLTPTAGIHTYSLRGSVQTGTGWTISSAGGLFLSSYFRITAV